MIPVQLDRPAWTSGDVQALQQFLSTESGRRFIGHLSYSRPEYKTFTTIEERAITSALVEGYEKGVEKVLALAKKPIE